VLNNSAKVHTKAPSRGRQSAGGSEARPRTPFSASRFFAIIISMAFHPILGIKPPQTQKSAPPASSQATGCRANNRPNCLQICFVGPGQAWGVRRGRPRLQSDGTSTLSITLGPQKPPVSDILQSLDKL
jgi:hypothetical protein